MSVKILTFLFGTALRKWITIGVISLLVGGFGWNAFKDNLRDEGRDEAIQECNEGIYKANQAVLERQLVNEQQRAHQLELRNKELRAENEAAIQSRTEAENRVTQLLSEREQQVQDDEDYREWNQSPVADGVADRLRRVAAGDRDSSPDNN